MFEAWNGEISVLWIRIILPDPDPHRAGENGSGRDPGSIKGSQNKGDKKNV